MDCRLPARLMQKGATAHLAGDPLSLRAPLSVAPASFPTSGDGEILVEQDAFQGQLRLPGIVRVKRIGRRAEEVDESLRVTVDEHFSIPPAGSARDFQIQPGARAAKLVIRLLVLFTFRQ